MGLSHLTFPLQLVEILSTLIVVVSRLRKTKWKQQQLTKDVVNLVFLGRALACYQKVISIFGNTKF